MRHVSTFTIALAVLVAACTGRPAPAETPTAGDETRLETTPGSPSPTVPFVPADCEDATVGGANVGIQMEDNVFDPACVVVLGGQNLRFANQGANLHNFSVEETQVDLDVSPGTNQNTGPVSELVAPGTYVFFCKYHRELGMEGELTVTAVG